MQIAGLSLFLLVAGLLVALGLRPLDDGHGPRRWFVFLNGTGTVQGASHAEVSARQAHFLHAIDLLGIHYTLRGYITGISNMVCLDLLHTRDVDDIRSLPGVRHIVHDGTERHRAYKLFGGSPDSEDEVRTVDDTAVVDLIPHIMTGVRRVHERNITGRGVRIGVFETGIDGAHPAFGSDCYRRRDDCPIAVWQDYVAALDRPRDCINAGHGTMVAGIISGRNGTFVGVAPDARLYVYRVYTCEGTASTLAFIIALNDAVVRDKVDVINLSFGEPDTQRVTALSIALRAAMDAAPHLVVVSAAGNQGSRLFSVGNPGTVLGVLSVASLDSTHVLARIMYRHEPNGNTVTANFLFSFAQPFQQHDLGREGLVIDLNPDVQRQLERGDIPHVRNRTVILYAAGTPTNQIPRLVDLMGKHGAKSVILAIDSKTLSTAHVRSMVGPTQIPWAKMTAASAVPMFGRKPGVLAITNITVGTADRVVRDADGGRISNFSSYGPTMSYRIKPEIAAYGSHVFTTLPMRAGAWGFAEGTSMSAPYVAGCAALLIEAQGRVPAALLRAALMAGAVPSFIEERRTESVIGQGAGLINVERSLDLPASLLPGGGFHLGNAGGGVQHKRTLKITNTDKHRTMHYVMSHAPAIAILLQPEATGASSAKLVDSPARVAFNYRVLQLAPGASRIIHLHMLAPDPAEQVLMYSGYVTMTPCASRPDPTSKPPLPCNPLAKYYMPYLGVSMAADYGHPQLRVHLVENKNERVQELWPASMRRRPDLHTQQPVSVQFSRADVALDVEVRVSTPTAWLAVVVYEVLGAERVAIGAVYSGAFALPGGAHATWTAADLKARTGMLQRTHNQEVRFPGNFQLELVAWTRLKPPNTTVWASADIKIPGPALWLS